MPLLKEADREILRQEFAALKNPVKLVMFTQTLECQFCAETRQICEEVAALSDQITLEVYNFVTDAEAVKAYQVDKIPAIAIVGDKDYGIRFYGIPSGYEFSSLVEDIKMVGSGESGLLPKTKEFLQGLTRPVHLQVFVTPTCPYCPRAVRLAHQMAMASDLVRGDAVEAIEFPHLAQRYQVHGVPRTVINDTTALEGAMPEGAVLQAIQKAVQ